MKRSRMRLNPVGEKVEILYPVIPSEYYDLGKIKIETVTSADLIEDRLQPKKISRPVYLNDGHVYFIQNQRRKVNALFEVNFLAN